MICFNPRTRTGCDQKTLGGISNVSSFNPRTRTGCDNKVEIPNKLINGFNPRTRTGCDTDQDIREGWSAVSIHAPARGATMS